MLSNHFNLFLLDVEVKELSEEGGGVGTQGGRRRITTRIMIGGGEVQGGGGKSVHDQLLLIGMSK